MGPDRPSVFSLSAECEQTTDRALTVPSSTAQLMALREYVDQTEAERIPQMEEQLRTVGERSAGDTKPSATTGLTLGIQNAVVESR